MQDQGKRLVIAVVVAAVILFGWNKFFPGEEPPKPTASQTTGSGQAAAPNQPRLTLPIGPRAGTPAAEAAPVPGETLQIASPRFVATFSSACGGLASWHLTDKRYERDATRGELLPAGPQLTDASGKPVPPKERANVPVCGAFEVNFVTGSTYVVPRNAAWSTSRSRPQALQAVLERDLGPEAKNAIVTAGQQIFEQGRQEGFQELLLRLLRRRFGDEVDAHVEQRVATASTEQIEAWSMRVLSATTLIDLFAD